MLRQGQAGFRVTEDKGEEEGAYEEEEEEGCLGANLLTRNQHVD